MEDSTQARWYSVGAAARETGISPDTLRVWERRYGKPEPVRLPSGHRRFSEEQVCWLRRVAEGLARGFRPGKLLALDPAGLEALLQSCQARTTEGGQPWVEELLDAAHDLDPLALRRCLERSHAAHGAKPWLSEILAPFLRRLGEAWADGSLGVRHEHLASGVAQAFLLERLAAAPPQDGRARCLCATLPEERHALGMLMAALVLAELGYPVQVLGPDLPLAELTEAARAATAEHQAAGGAGAGVVVALSVPLSSGGVDTDRRIRELRRELAEEVPLLVGGAGARGSRRGVQGVTYLEDLADLKAWASGSEYLS